MPRGGSFKSSGFKSSSSRGASPTRNTTYAQAPIRQSAPTTQSGSTGGVFSGFMGTMVQGMAFGAGSEVAHQAVRSVMGTNHDQQQVVVQQAAPQEMTQQQRQTNKCEWENNSFIECLKINGNALGDCQGMFDMLKACENRHA